MTDSKRRVTALVGTLVIGVVVGLLIGVSLDGGDSEEAPSDSTPVAVGPGPTSEQNGVPIGYARTKAGAVSAATNFALVSANDDVWTMERYQLAMQTLATDSWRDAAREQATTGYEFVVERYGPDADISGAALRYQLLDFSPEAAVVKLWTVSVISGREQLAIEQAWGTSVVRLVWSDGDWRVDEITNSSGPAPIELPGTENPEDARSLMEEMDEYKPSPRI